MRVNKTNNTVILALKVICYRVKVNKDEKGSSYLREEHNLN